MEVNFDEFYLRPIQANDNTKKFSLGARSGVEHVRIQKFIRDEKYNEERPHQTLNSMTPVQYRLITHPETSS